jgi:hypothetical protein
MESVLLVLMEVTLLQIAMVFDWDALSLEKRRRLVFTVWESITIVGTRKGARWDDSTVELVPRKVG